MNIFLFYSWFNHYHWDFKSPNSTICSSSSLDKSIAKEIAKSKNKIDISNIVANDLSKKLKTKKIDQVVFDRSGYRFHGRVKAIADTLRDNGIKI